MIGDGGWGGMEVCGGGRVWDPSLEGEDQGDGAGLPVAPRLLQVGGQESERGQPAWACCILSLSSSEETDLESVGT